MKVFGREVSNTIKFPQFIERFAGRIIPKLHSDNKELVSIPSTNISDEETAFELSIALPGLDKKDVKIEVKGNTLIISGEKEQSQEAKDKHWVRKEFVRNAFYRAFNIPMDAAPERISAEMKNGLLQIKIAKKESKKRTLKVA